MALNGATLFLALNGATLFSPFTPIKFQIESHFEVSKIFLKENLVNFFGVF